MVRNSVSSSSWSPRLFLVCFAWCVIGLRSNILDAEATVPSSSGSLLEFLDDPLEVNRCSANSEPTCNAAGCAFLAGTCLPLTCNQISSPEQCDFRAGCGWVANQCKTVGAYTEDLNSNTPTGSSIDCSTSSTPRRCRANDGCTWVIGRGCVATSPQATVMTFDFLEPCSSEYSLSMLVNCLVANHTPVANTRMGLLRNSTWYFVDRVRLTVFDRQDAANDNVTVIVEARIAQDLNAARTHLLEVIVSPETNQTIQVFANEQINNTRTSTVNARCFVSSNASEWAPLVNVSSRLSSLVTFLIERPLDLLPNLMQYTNATATPLEFGLPQLNVDTYAVVPKNNTSLDDVFLVAERSANRPPFIPAFLVDAVVVSRRQVSSNLEIGEQCPDSDQLIGSPYLPVIARTGVVPDLLNPQPESSPSANNHQRRLVHVEVQWSSLTSEYDAQTISSIPFPVLHAAERRSLLLVTTGTFWGVNDVYVWTVEDPYPRIQPSAEARMQPIYNDIQQHFGGMNCTPVDPPQDANPVVLDILNNVQGIQNELNALYGPLTDLESSMGQALSQSNVLERLASNIVDKLAPTAVKILNMLNNYYNSAFFGDFVNPEMDRILDLRDVLLNSVIPKLQTWASARARIDLLFITSFNNRIMALNLLATLRNEIAWLNTVLSTHVRNVVTEVWCHAEEVLPYLVSIDAELSRIEDGIVRFNSNATRYLNLLQTVATALNGIQFSDIQNVIQGSDNLDFYLGGAPQRIYNTLASFWFERRINVDFPFQCSRTINDVCTSELSGARYCANSSVRFVCGFDFVTLCGPRTEYVACQQSGWFSVSELAPMMHYGDVTIRDQVASAVKPVLQGISLPSLPEPPFLPPLPQRIAQGIRNAVNSIKSLNQHNLDRINFGLGNKLPASLNRCFFLGVRSGSSTDYVANFFLYCSPIGTAIIGISEFTRSPSQTPSINGPTGSPTASTSRPSASPSPSPTVTPTFPPQIFISPTISVSSSPTSSPTSSPSTSQPTRHPTRSPTGFPSRAPFTAPSTARPRPLPTRHPTMSPSATPTISPSTAPTASPSASPSGSPSAAPTAFTNSPSAAPSSSPSSVPTNAPSAAPTSSPSATPTTSPSSAPSSSPSNAPTSSPSAVPSASPSLAPFTILPTSLPTSSPTFGPSVAPVTILPTTSPTSNPSISPSISPVTILPSVRPTVSPTVTPSVSPSAILPSVRPTVSPTGTPSAAPSTILPSVHPTVSPTVATSTSLPTAHPTLSPTATTTTTLPTRHPTKSPTLAPSTTLPTRRPSSSPTLKPSLVLPTRHPTRSPTETITTSLPSKRPTTSSPLGNPPTGAPTESISTSEPSRAPTVSFSISASPTRSTTGSRFPTKSPSQSFSTQTESPAVSPIPNTRSPTRAKRPKQTALTR